MATENSKELILNTALSLFARKGYDGVGVQEICSLAGITKPSLYYYFKNKQGLLLAIAENKGEVLFERLKNALVYRHDFIKGLTDSLYAALTFAVEEPDFFNLHCLLCNAPENSEGKIVYAPLAERILDLFKEFFLLSANEFGNMRGKEKLYALLYHNNITSLSVLKANGQMEFSDQTVYQIVHAFVYGVAN